MEHGTRLPARTTTPIVRRAWANNLPAGNCPNPMGVARLKFRTCPRVPIESSAGVSSVCLMGVRRDKAM